MDLSNCSSLTSVAVLGDDFYFQVADADFEADTYKKSTDPSKIRFIKNNDNQFLIVGNGDKLLFQPTLQQSQADISSAQFTIQTYKNNSKCSNRGIAVTMFAMKDNIQKVVCCSQTGEIHADTLDALPDQIETCGHKALFFLKCVPGVTGIFTVESSLCHSRFLGFEADAHNLSMNRLILRPRQERQDEIDECTNFKLFQCKA